MPNLRSPWMTSVSAVALVALTADRASGQRIVSANDGKITVVNGVNVAVRSPVPDTVTLIDLSTVPGKIIAEIKAPTSVIGPPQSVAFSPDDSIVLVTASTKIDPADPTKMVPDDIVTVIDVKATPPVVLATLHAGSGAAGVSINPAGTLALVANRSDGSVSVFTIDGKSVRASAKIPIGPPESLPSHVVFTPDGRQALVTRNGDSLISVLAINGTTVTNTNHDIAAGLKPYAIEITPAGDLALVANIGAGASGGADTISIIDLRMTPPRTIDNVTVGPVPEGLSISPDGHFVAMTVMNGSNLAPTSPLFNDFGRLRVFSIANRTLTPVAEARIGHWCQGAAWGSNQTVVAQCMIEKEIVTFRFDGKTLTPAGFILVTGGPAGIRRSHK